MVGSISGYRFLNSLKVNSSAPKSIGDNAFYNCSKLEKISSDN